jgi:hypothetical protein
MQEHPMPTNRKFGFLRLWRWTVELFSSGLILALWNTPRYELSCDRPIVRHGHILVEAA